MIIDTKNENAVDIVIDLDVVSRIQSEAVSSGPIIFNKQVGYSDAQTILTLLGFTEVLKNLGIRPQFKISKDLVGDYE